MAIVRRRAIGFDRGPNAGVINDVHVPPAVLVPSGNWNVPEAFLFITLRPLGLSFRLPAAWFIRYSLGGGETFVAGGVETKERGRVKSGEGEGSHCQRNVRSVVFCLSMKVKGGSGIVGQ